MSVKNFLIVKQPFGYVLTITTWIVLLLGLVLNHAHATYPPTFSDCIYGDGQDYDQVDACQQLIRSNRKKRDLHVALGKTLEKRQKHSEAVKAYQYALQIFPEDEYFKNKLSLTTSNLKEQQWLQNKEKIALKPKQKQFLEQLNFLSSLKSQGIISTQEYEQRKKALLVTNFSVAKTENTSETPQETIESKSEASPALTSDYLNGLNFGNYHALIIGNNDYQHLRKLQTAVNDATVLADLLKKEYGFKVKLLLNANRYDTLTAMDEYRKTLTKKDNLLIYYAGHGVLDKASERGYWLPVDAESDSTSNWISIADITDTLKTLQSWHVLVVADSCYSGTLARSTAVTLPTPEEKRTLFKRLLKKKSRTVITSGGLEPVTDSGGDNHSVFAQAFIGVLRGSETAIETEQIFSRLRDKVILNADQTPEYSNVRKVGHNGGDFIFVRQ